MNACTGKVYRTRVPEASPFFAVVRDLKNSSKFIRNNSSNSNRKNTEALRNVAREKAATTTAKRTRHILVLRLVQAYFSKSYMGKIKIPISISFC